MLVTSDPVPEPPNFNFFLQPGHFPQSSLWHGGQIPHFASSKLLLSLVLVPASCFWKKFSKRCLTRGVVVALDRVGAVGFLWLLTGEPAGRPPLCWVAPTLWCKYCCRRSCLFNSSNFTPEYWHRSCMHEAWVMFNSLASASASKLQIWNQQKNCVVYFFMGC